MNITAPKKSTKTLQTQTGLYIFRSDQAALSLHYINRRRNLQGTGGPHLCQRLAFAIDRRGIDDPVDSLIQQNACDQPCAQY